MRYQENQKAGMKNGKHSLLLPCLLCGAKLEKRIDKNRKPYFVCNPCGIQLFVRRQQGIDLLEQLIGSGPQKKGPHRSGVPSRAPDLLQEINGAKTQINLLKKEVHHLSRELKELASSR
jgi:hypothetical protein